MQLCVYTLYKHTHVYKYFTVENQKTFTVGNVPPLFSIKYAYIFKFLEWELG